MVPSDTKIATKLFGGADSETHPFTNEAAAATSSVEIGATDNRLLCPSIFRSVSFTRRLSGEGTKLAAGSSAPSVASTKEATPRNASRKDISNPNIPLSENGAAAFCMFGSLDIPKSYTRRLVVSIKFIVCSSDSTTACDPRPRAVCAEDASPNKRQSSIDLFK